MEKNIERAKRGIVINEKLLSDVNKRICDRTDCFYWQTDRRITVEEQSAIWKYFG